MNIIKQELKDRQFTPYKIIVTIDSELEHQELLQCIDNLEKKNSEAFSSFGNIQSLIGNFTALGKLLGEIKKHIK